MTESQLKSAIIEALNRCGCTVWRNQTGRARRMVLAPTGSPDVIVYTRFGRFIGLEIKLANGVVSEAQQQWIDRMKAAGCVAGVVRSVQEAIDVVSPAMQIRESATSKDYAVRTR